MVRYTLLQGFCEEVLPNLPENSFDAVVTDPPYGIDFMGKKWDYDVPSVEQWRQILRVLKPGGHLLSFASTRTHHRMAVNIEDAGFEIRDMIAWVYGSGFPKSHDVGKAIDAHQRGQLIGEKLIHFSVVRGIDGAWLEARGVADAKSFHDWTQGGHAPSDKNWGIIKTALGVTPEEELSFERSVIDIGRSGPSTVGYIRSESKDYATTSAATPEAKPWNGWGTALKPALEPIVVARKPLIGTVAQNVLKHGTGAINIDGCRVPVKPVDGPTAFRYADAAWEQDENLCASCAERAKRDAGQKIQETLGNSVVKPVGRTSSEKGRTALVATNRPDIGCSAGPSPAGHNENLTESSSSSTGACGEKREGLFPQATASITKTGTNSTIGSRTCASCGLALISHSTRENTPLTQSEGTNTLKGLAPEEPKGRWPSNLLHDGSDEVMGVFPDAPGQMANASTNAEARKTQNVYGAMRRGRGDEPSADSENDGVVGFKMKPGMRRLDSGSAARFFYCSKASKSDRGEGNDHPTVKPTDLMRYLVRLVTPPGGRLLDPFAGSGSTLKAALLEGFDCLGIDRDKDGTYLPIAHSRLEPLSEGPMPLYPDLLPPAHVRVVETGGRIVMADNDDNVYFEVCPDGYDKDGNAVWSSQASKDTAYRRALALKYVLDTAQRPEVAAGPPLKAG